MPVAETSAVTCAASTDARWFRHVLSHFATGVTVATACTAEGRPVGVTINSFTSVSLDPPLVLFCLGRRARTLPVFTAAGGFAINVLAAGQRDLADRFVRRPTDFGGLDYAAWETGAPILDGCLAALDCAVAARHDGGDHVILVGRVLRLADFGEGAPLVYHRGRYTGLATAD